MKAEVETEEMVEIEVYKVMDLILERQFQINKRLALTDAETREGFFGFTGRDVVAIHYTKRGFPFKGLFFRLRDGRVFDAAARPHEPDRCLYDATTH